MSTDTTINLADLFIKAADYIDEVGWGYGADRSWDLPYLVVPKGATCITNAIVMTRQGGLGMVETVYPLVRLLGYSNVTELWQANDNQPDYETGKSWAIAQLKKAANLWLAEQAGE